VDVIYRNARTLTQLVEDMLDMNRILMGRVKLDLQIIDLATVISAAAESVSPSADLKQIRILKEIDPEVSEIRGDPTRLQQVIWNLLTNAIKFTPKEGTVEVMLDRYQDYARISVRDTGIGIKQEFLPRVFERFTQEDSSTTRKYGGLGLGLAIVKNLVELHSGSVVAESEGEGRGATFRVLLPLPPVLSRLRAARNDSREPITYPDGLGWDGPSLKGKNVLVVDDDPDAAEIVSRILSQYGAEVTTVQSGPTALSLLDTSRYDVLISDIAMPEMDGYEFVRTIRGSGNRVAERIPAIALTAFSRSEDRRRAMLAGFDMFLSKPVDPPELVAVVSRYAERGQS
jgi:CheY-like chemotaxis protein